MLPYTLADWYWFVGGDETRAYSSKWREYIQAGDLAEFYRIGGVPTNIDTEFNLGTVLGPLPFAQQPLPPGVNAGYIAFKQEQNELWLNHETRLRTVEMQLGILSPSLLPQSIK